MEILGQTLAGRLVLLCLIALSFVGCSSDGAGDGMHTDAPKMDAAEQKKLEESRHDPETQKMLDSRPR
jgi:PBP1b-binding outer membrane lipoprotein LpoB